jgi:hypothetical protein
MSKNTTIKVYNEWHLGDHIFNFIMLNNVKDYLEHNNVIIEYYCESVYHSQLSEFNFSNNVRIKDYCKNNNGFNLWIGNSRDFEINAYNYNGNGYKYDDFLVLYFNNFLKKQSIPIVINKLEYNDPTISNYYETIDKKYNGKYSNLDILILNSTPRSGQYVKDNDKWTPFILKLNKKYKIVSTEKVDGVYCTWDDHLTVKEIQAISSHSRKIIAISSGPITSLFNTLTLENVEVIYSFSYADKYAHPKFVNMVDTNELDFLLDIGECYV